MLRLDSLLWTCGRVASEETPRAYSGVHTPTRPHVYTPSIMRRLFFFRRVRRRLRLQRLEPIPQRGEALLQIRDLSLLAIDNVAQLRIRALEVRDLELQALERFRVDHLSPSSSSFASSASVDSSLSSGAIASPPMRTRPRTF